VSSEITGARDVRVPDEWYVGFHQGLAARFWRAAGATMTDADAGLLARLLGDAPLDVLDAPCGDGRLAIRLAAAGHTVTGVDLAPDEIEEARAAARRAGVDARFLVGDLRALPATGRVDAVVSWGNSFGYLVPADTARSLAGMRAALRPGGRLVLDTATVAEALLPRGVEDHAEYEFGGIRMTLANRYRPLESRLEADVVFEAADGRVERARIAHHVHTTGELAAMLRNAGFAAVDLLGPDGAARYELGMPRLVVVAMA
jgi:SAM-dependent methyltransferase